MSATRLDYENNGRLAFKSGTTLDGATKGRKPGTWQFTAIVDGWHAARNAHQKALHEDMKAQAAETPPVVRATAHRVFSKPSKLPENHPSAIYFKDWDPGAREHVRFLALEIASEAGVNERRFERLQRSFKRVFARHSVRSGNAFRTVPPANLTQ